MTAVQGWPKLSAFRPYLGIATTLLARTVFTMCSYTSITAAATSLGTPEAAAHQVTLQLFWFLSCESFECLLKSCMSICTEGKKEKSALLSIVVESSGALYPEQPGWSALHISLVSPDFALGCCGLICPVAVVTVGM